MLKSLIKGFSNERLIKKLSKKMERKFEFWKNVATFPMPRPSHAKFGANLSFIPRWSLVYFFLPCFLKSHPLSEQTGGSSASFPDFTDNFIQRFLLETKKKLTPFRQIFNIFHKISDSLLHLAEGSQNIKWFLKFSYLVYSHVRRLNLLVDDHQFCYTS